MVRGSAIMCLFVFRCPSTIKGLIASVVVDAINGMGERGPSSHIRKEVFKAVQPSLAYQDAASAVISPSFMPGISAALKHGIPNAVFSAVTRLTIRFAMKVASRCDFFAVQASATARKATRQISATDVFHLPTITKTFPEDRTARCAACLAKDNEPFKALISEFKSRPSSSHWAWTLV